MIESCFATITQNQPQKECIWFAKINAIFNYYLK